MWDVSHIRASGGRVCDIVRARISRHGGPMAATRNDDERRATRAIIADDDALARRVVRDALQDAGIVVIAEAADGREAIELSAYYRPDVVLMDLVMPGVGGLEATRTLASEQPEVRVLVLSSADEDELGFLSVRMGAVGFLPKDTAVETLPRAVEAAARNEAVISRHMTMRLIHDMRRLREDGAGLRPVHSPLSRREWEVLDCLCEEWSTEQIADHMLVSVETIRTHVKSILRKLKVRSRAEAVAIARTIRSSLILQSPSEP
jgi:DNA-binding NarL/FixJ family response regulator